MTENKINLHIKNQIKEAALALGFNKTGIVQIEPPPQGLLRLYDFLKEGRHGEMDWMERSADRRAHPMQIWPEARSALLLGVNYTPHTDPLEVLTQKEKGAISVYAQGDDYHLLLKKKAKLLSQKLTVLMNAKFKIFVDTGPLMEKPFAASAGLGWQGKHTNLVSRSYGSWLFLCALLTDAKLDPDEASPNHCGSCHRCLDICPTKAFPAPYQLDARRCISYLTIEHKSQIPKEFRSQIGNRIFGCDDCLAVCPWNKFAEKANEARWHVREECINPPLQELLNLTEETFQKRFAETSIKRTGRDRFIRNVLIAVGNSGDRIHAPKVRELLKDFSPLVRGMAIWAASKLLTPSEFMLERTKYLPQETIAFVRDEWVLESN